MKTLRPDAGSSVRLSKLYDRNGQYMQAFKFLSDGQEWIVELPAASFQVEAGAPVTRSKIEWM